jgi:hypothetical protein
MGASRSQKCPWIRIGSALGGFGLALWSSGCTTVNAPVLRHQTGETLGQKKFRVSGHLETSRLFQPSSTVETAGIAQNTTIFQGSLLGVQAEAGVMPQLDLQGGANFTASGGGWKAGAKYQFFKNARFAASGMLGYAVSSGSGTVTYLTGATPVEISETLSAQTLDLSVPVSFRVGPMFAIYSGLMLLRSSVSGSLGTLVVSDVSYDLGTNLGMKITSGIFEGDLEFAFLSVNDPFALSRRMVPYAGLSFGVTF